MSFNWCLDSSSPVARCGIPYTCCIFGHKIIVKNATDAKVLFKLKNVTANIMLHI